MLATVNCVTPAFIAGLPDVNGQTVVWQFEFWSASCCVRIIFERCCVFWTNFLILYYIQSDDKSIVYQNRSGVCLDRSQYTGSKSFTDSNIGWSGTCDQFITSSDENAISALGRVKNCGRMQ